MDADTRRQAEPMLLMFGVNDKCSRLILGQMHSRVAVVVAQQHRPKHCLADVNGIDLLNGPGGLDDAGRFRPAQRAADGQFIVGQNVNADLAGSARFRV